MGMGSKLHATAALLSGMRLGATCIGGWVGSRVGLIGRGRFHPLLDSIPEPSSWLSYPGPHLDLSGEVTRG
jgi:hypothetical protein